MVRRWGLPMTIKVDLSNGGSQQLMVGTEDLPPGKSIPMHKHSHCDELVIVQQGTGTASLGRRGIRRGTLIATLKLSALFSQLSESEADSNNWALTTIVRSRYGLVNSATSNSIIIWRSLLRTGQRGISNAGKKSRRNLSLI